MALKSRRKAHRETCERLLGRKLLYLGINLAGRPTQQFMGCEGDNRILDIIVAVVESGGKPEMCV